MGLENWLNDPPATCKNKVLSPTKHESVRKDMFMPSPRKKSFLLLEEFFIIKLMKRKIIPIEKFQSAMEWYEYCRSLGFAVPVQAGYQISRCMKENKLSFYDAYQKCLSKETILELPDINVVVVARP